MRRSISARHLRAGGIVVAGAGVVTGASLPWLTTLTGMQGYAAVEGLPGRVLAGLGAGVVVGGLVLAWRETALARRAVLLVALAAALLAGWMLAHAEGRYVSLADDALTTAERGAGGFLALAAALLATGLALVPVPAQAPAPAAAPARARRPRPPGPAAVLR